MGIVGLTTLLFSAVLSAKGFARKRKEESMTLSSVLEVGKNGERSSLFICRVIQLPPVAYEL